MTPKFTVNPHRSDPYRNFKFRVIWDGRPVAGITKVSPLQRITEVIEYREGGDPSLIHKLPARTKYAPITLEQGVTHDTAFEDWANLVHNLQGDAAMSLKNYRKDIIIQLLNQQGTVVKAYKVYRCWVSEYQALPELNANSPTVAIERITLENEGWERDTEVTEPTES
ncbi:MAG: phage tail protein [Candidatus Heimdallarchaeota archaeon]